MSTVHNLLKLIQILLKYIRYQNRNPPGSRIEVFKQSYCFSFLWAEFKVKYSHSKFEESEQKQLNWLINNYNRSGSKSMYNSFMVNKKSVELEELKKKSEANMKYVKRYYNITRPALIDNHNKRINSFIRRMEQQPFQITADSQLKLPLPEENENALNSSKKRSHSHATGRKETSSLDQYDSGTLHHHKFRFKDNEDWRSMYTPLQRIQRQRNYELFKHKYGDPTIAYRSIGSQSEYKPGHEFRERDKSQEINPPMKYTNKPTQQILAKLKSRHKNRNKEKAKLSETRTNLNLNQAKEEDALVRRNTGSSVSGMNQDNILGDNQTQRDRGSRQDQQTDRQNENGNEKNNDKEKKDKKPFKLHFKQIMDLEQSISDVKTRKALRQILYKCGLYKRKNRRAVTDSEVDQLSQFTEGRDH